MYEEENEMNKQKRYEVRCPYSLQIVAEVNSVDEYYWYAVTRTQVPYECFDRVEKKTINLFTIGKEL